MDITKLRYTPDQMAELILYDDDFANTSWGRKTRAGLAEMIAQAPDPELLELAKAGLELARKVDYYRRKNGDLPSSYEEEINELARAIVRREKAGRE